MNKNNNIKEKIINEIRNPKIYLIDILNYVEKNVEDAFNICCRKNLSINEKYPDSKYQGQLGQKTVFISVRMFDLWETAIIEILSTNIKTKFPMINIKPINDTIGDMAIIFPYGEEMRWEIKTSQGQDSFTGATHSASKCNNYILINYSINRDLKLKQGIRNEGFIKELAVFVWNDMEAEWMGEPSKNSSFTSLKIPSEIKIKRPEIIVVGDLQPKTKWCRIKRKELYQKDLF